MQHRTRIPVLALMGLHFTGCAGDDDKPNPIVGDWGAVQLDGDKLPSMYSEGPYSSVYGLRMNIEDDLVGAFEYYSVLDYDSYEYRHSYGSELVVDDSAAPKYRIEVQKISSAATSTTPTRSAPRSPPTATTTAATSATTRRRSIWPRRAGRSSRRRSWS
ncbi:hypothetical protein OV079_32870 [Nannocystis pusilla]|uniref:Uncharacterized protein n=1 Tax=Nannocystis pusilla TaxID=889268 RepID=A0A9X3EU14_9BACT|nr:hypothetical protein [Nannocystis pusilla]MCY1010279.1 hypothetical protein [Nannocystis pusilla]